MRLLENRFEREMRRAHLVARMLFHEARTGTIAAWTGASHEQVRKIARSTRETPSGRAQVRHRGQSPKQLAYFFRSALIGSHAAVLGFLFEHTGALPHEERAVPEKIFRCVSRAEQLCEAFDAYRAMLGEPVIPFEYAVLLLTSLAFTRELSLDTCENCGGLWILDRLGRPKTRCAHCRASASKLEPRASNSATLRNRLLALHPVQLNLFDNGP